MKVGVLGSGVVGKTLADGFLKHGHEVMRGSREPQKLADWQKSAGAKGQIGSFAETARFGELVVLAVKGSAAEAVLTQAGAENLKRKTVIDTTNPIGDKPPQNGVLHYFTDLNDSLMERLQRKFPDAQLVKAFSCVGNAFMVNPDFGGVKPSMFICGNHDGAKEAVRGILDRFGWEVEDMGKVEAARAIEPLCMLWCINGMRKNEWSRAFKFLSKSR